MSGVGLGTAPDAEAAEEVLPVPIEVDRKRLELCRLGGEEVGAVIDGVDVTVKVAVAMRDALIIGIVADAVVMGRDDNNVATVLVVLA